MRTRDTGMDSKQIAEGISALIKKSGLEGPDLKTLLRDVVSTHWPGLPVWSTLNAPLIEEVQKTNLGACVCMVFTEDDVQKVVIAQAGTHYKQARGGDLYYILPGGFANLTRTPGSTLVPPDNKPETARIAAAREAEEELKNPDGSPLIAVDPARLVILDSVTLAFPNGEILLANGSIMHLTDDEVVSIKNHIHAMQTDAGYKAAVLACTLNEDTNLPEVGGLHILDLNDLADKKYPLIHADQQSLFIQARAYFDRLAAAAKPRAASSLLKAEPL